MFLLRAGDHPEAVPLRSFARLISVALAGLMAGACSSTETAAPSSHWSAVASAQTAGPRVEVEDDGLPAQTPPSPRIRHLPDDPSEPWSPNYGGGSPAPVAEAQAPDNGYGAPPPLSKVAAIPDDLPVEFRRQLAEAITH